MQNIQYLNKFLTLLFLILLSASCQHKIKENKDSVYSRHLQKHVDLEILSTPIPDNKSSYNLLLLNDGQDVENLRVKTIIDSLYKKKLISPLVVVAINAYNREDEYGISGYVGYKKSGTSAAKYSAFVDDELIPFIRKRSGVRKFNSITIAGCSLGGLSAFDIAWDHADKIDKVGVFSGYKDASDATYSDDKDRLIINKIRSSRKKPHLKYWFYAGGNEETADRDNDGIIDVVDDTKDVIELIKTKKVCPPADIFYTELKDGKHDNETWSKVFPQFVIWAVGK